MKEEPHLFGHNYITVPRSAPIVPPTAPLVDLSLVPSPRSAPALYEAPTNIPHFQFPVGEQDKQNVTRQRKSMEKGMEIIGKLTATSFEGKSKMDGSSSGRNTKRSYDQKDLKSPIQLTMPHPPLRRSSASRGSSPVQLTTKRPSAAARIPSPAQLTMPHPPPAVRESSDHQPRQLRRHQRYEMLQNEGHERNGMTSLANESADPRMKSSLARRNEARPLLSRPKWEYQRKLPPIGKDEELLSVDVEEEVMLSGGELASRYKNAPVMNETVTELGFPWKTSEQKDTPNWLRSNKLPPIFR